jgi:hypothetical protein
LTAIHILLLSFHVRQRDDIVGNDWQLKRLPGLEINWRAFLIAELMECREGVDGDPSFPKREAVEYVKGLDFYIPDWRVGVKLGDALTITLGSGPEFFDRSRDPSLVLEETVVFKTQRANLSET